MGVIFTREQHGTAAYFACCACQAELKKSFSGKKVCKRAQGKSIYFNLGHMYGLIYQHIYIYTQYKYIDALAISQNEFEPPKQLVNTANPLVASCSGQQRPIGTAAVFTFGRVTSGRGLDMTFVPTSSVMTCCGCNLGFV